MDTLTSTLGYTRTQLANTLRHLSYNGVYARGEGGRGRRPEPGRQYHRAAGLGQGRHLRHLGPWPQPSGEELLRILYFFSSAQEIKINIGIMSTIYIIGFHIGVCFFVNDDRLSISSTEFIYIIIELRGLQKSEAFWYTHDAPTQSNHKVKLLVLVRVMDVNGPKNREVYVRKTFYAGDN